MSDLYEELSACFPDYYLTLEQDFKGVATQNVTVTLKNSSHFYRLEIPLHEVESHKALGIATYLAAKLRLAYPELNNQEPIPKPKKINIPADMLKNPSLVPKEKTVPVVVGPDLSQLQKGMEEVFKAMGKQAEVLGKEFEKLAAALAPFLDELQALTEQNQPPGITIANQHPGMNIQMRCPKCGANGVLRSTIIHLNDEHKWTREDIANWLDTLDEQPVFYPAVVEDAS